MSGQSYLEALGAALSRVVPIQERMNILRYYKEYFEDAGLEREQEIIAELGDPNALAARIAAEGGWLDDGEEEAVERPRKKRPWLAAAGVALLVLAILGTTVGGLAVAWGVLRNNLTRSHAHSEPVPSVEAGTAYTFTDYGDVTSIYEMPEGVAVGLPGVFSTAQVDIDLGNVVVTRGDEFGVWVDNDLSPGYGITWSVTGDGLTVGSVMNGSGRFKDLQSLRDAGNVCVTVTVPWNWDLSCLEVDTSLGDVTIDRVFAGRLSVETGAGNILATGMEGAMELSLSTGVGNIALDGWQPASAQLDTGMGNIHADLLCSQRECDYSLDTGMGEIWVDGSLCGQSAVKQLGGSCLLNASTGMGNVDVGFLG